MWRLLMTITVLLGTGVVIHYMAGNAPGTDSAVSERLDTGKDERLVEFKPAGRESGGPSSDQTMSLRSLIGIRVINPLDEDIGEVTDLVVDRQGCLVGMVVHVGGVMGIGGEQVSIPIDKVNIDPRGGTNPPMILVRETRRNMLTSE